MEKTAKQKGIRIDGNTWRAAKHEATDWDCSISDILTISVRHLLGSPAPAKAKIISEYLLKELAAKG
jgi:hypothetical protein